MKKRIVDLHGYPLLNVVSYGRGGSRSLSDAQIEHISLTVGGAPEVMVKVSGGGRTISGVAAHFGYIGRHGKVGVETDEGERWMFKGFAKALTKNWDLELDEGATKPERNLRGRRRTFKLVHNLVFSMPAGTPTEKVMKAVRKFAREEFALKHRYALALHTDEPHPHVHVVVKAISEKGERLNIRKATLRYWRQQFAHNLRELGVPANATERAVRGEVKVQKRTPILRAQERGASVNQQRRDRKVIQEVAQGKRSVDPGKRKLLETRRQITRGWAVIHDLLEEAGQAAVARQVRRFLSRMPPVATEQEQRMEQLRRSFERAPERLTSTSAEVRY